MPVFALSPIDLRVDSWSINSWREIHMHRKKRRWSNSQTCHLKNVELYQKITKNSKNSEDFRIFPGAWFRKLWKWRCGYVWQLNMKFCDKNLQSWNFVKNQMANIPSFEPLQRHEFPLQNRITETTKAVYLQAVFRKCVRKKTQAPSWSAPCIWSIWASTKTLQGQLPATGWTSLDLWKLQTTHELIRTRSIIASVSISLQIFA